MTRPVRTRFAPSPTGFLHIGGVRTALFCWLYARRHGGKYLIRIEDTDLERSEQRYTDDILASMHWLGLDSDEEPVYQSKRIDLYRKLVEGLIEKGHAYRCYCTAEEVELMRLKAQDSGARPQYDRTCREKKLPHRSDQAYVIRAKIPLDGHVEFKDLIRGPIRVENTEVDDFVLIRSSGATTYNLSCVVDDFESQITQVIRGDDHINNTPKQIHLYRAFGYPEPEFAHLPMILGPDKKKLSKRHGAVSANVYRADGYLPEALLNFLARLGWSHGDQEIFTIEELCRFFDFDHVQKASAVFNTEKLLWLNGEHIRKAPSERLQKIVIEDYPEHFAGSGATTGELVARARAPLAAKLVALIQPKVKVIKELAEQLVPLVTPGAVEVDASQLKWKDANAKPAILLAVQAVADLLSEKVNAAGPAALRERGGADAVWGKVPSLGDLGMGHTEIDAFLRQVADTRGIKLGDLAGPMRLAVTGRMVSAGLFELLSVLPWDVVEPRLRKAREF